MAIPYTIRQVRNALLAIALISTLTTACKKSGIGGADVDPRDQYVGTYEGGYQAAIQIADGDPLDSEVGTATVSITKSSSAREIYLDILFNKVNQERLTAELDATGTKFTILDKKQDQIVLNNTKIDAQYSATGVFDVSKKEVAITTTSEALRGGVRYVKRGAITGTMK